MWVTTGGGIGRFSRPGGVLTRLLFVDNLLLVECVLGNDNDGETDSAEVYMRFSMVNGAMGILVLLRVLRVSLLLTSCWFDEATDETGEDNDEAVELRSGLEYLGGGLLW